MTEKKEKNREDFDNKIYDEINIHSINIEDKKYSEGLEILKEGFKSFNIIYDDLMIKKLIVFYEMLVEKNKVMNLTGITEFKEVVIKHFLDSISIVKVCDEFLKIRECDSRDSYKVIDVGTGAGFPGIPLKIVFPELKITLLDSLNKRLVFLNEVIDRLALDDIETVHGRCEELAKNKLYREKFDYCVSRAVANLSSLNELCLGFVKKNGVFVSYKGKNGDEEISEATKSIKLMGGKLKSKEYFKLANTDMERVFIVIEKIENTPARFPRKSGMPTKEPLG